MTADDVTTVQPVLVNSDSYADAIASLPQDLQAKVTRALVDAFSTGLAWTMLVAAALSVAARSAWP